MAAPSALPPQGHTVMGSHYEEIMKELNARSDEVAYLNAQKNDRDAVVQNAETHFRTSS